MAGANLKTNTIAAQVGKLETELKTAFKEGRFETVRKKAEDIRKVDPENRLATRILEKVQEEEVGDLKKANANRIKILESKMDQAFRAGDLPGVNRLMGEVKKLDPKNRKVLGFETTIEKAKSALGAEMRKEKIQRLVAEVEFFVNKADWGGSESKANELLALEWNHPVALRAIGKVAKSKRVRPETLIAVKAPKMEARPGFFARLFTKKSESAKPSAAKAPIVEAVKPLAEVKKVEPVKAVPASVVRVTTGPAKVETKSEKPGFFAGLFAKKPASVVRVTTGPESAKVKEAPKVSVLKPMAKPASVVRVTTGPAVIEAVKPLAEAKPVARPVMVEVKKSELLKTVPTKVEPKLAKPGFFARLFAKKTEGALPKVTSKVAVQPSVAKPASVVRVTTGPAVAEIAKPVALVAQAKAVEPQAERVVPKFNALANMLDTKPAVYISPKDTPAPSMPMKAEVSILKPIVPVIPPKPMAEAKPMVPATVLAEPKSSVFGSLFAKKEEPKAVATAQVPMAKPVIMPTGQAVKAAEAQTLVPAAIAVAPMAPKPELKPMATTGSAPMASKTAETQLRVEQKTVAKPETNTLEKGNIFTSLFGKEEVEPTRKTSTSVLETIVAKTAPAKAEAKKEKVPEERTGEGLLSFASVLLKFSILFILVSAAFLYVENMDTGNNVLGLVKKENNAIQLHNADESLVVKKAELDKANKEIGKYKGGYTDEHQKAIGTIIANRMDWPSILAKLNEVTESVYAKNAISQYVQYNNYNYNTGTGKFTVAGTLSDPLGKNLTKLAELEQAFRTYPKDISNPNDDRKPYFFGLAQFTAYSKALDSATGRYKSSFSLSVSTGETQKK